MVVLLVLAAWFGPAAELQPAGRPDPAGTADPAFDRVNRPPRMPQDATERGPPAPAMPGFAALTGFVTR